MLCFARVLADLALISKTSRALKNMMRQKLPNAMYNTPKISLKYATPSRPQQQQQTTTNNNTQQQTTTNNDDDAGSEKKSDDKSGGGGGGGGVV